MLVQALMLLWLPKRFSNILDLYACSDLLKSAIRRL